jgi:hypothetical protein
MQTEYAGKKWTKKASGYYQSTTKFNDGKRKWLHQFIWQEVNGEQPSGFDIHHIDGDKGNNSISNLKLISRSEHQQLHGKEYFSNNTEAALQHLEVIRDKAKEWHKSPEGRKWHKKHRETIADKILAKDKVRACAQCGSTVMSHLKTKNVYCNRACEFKFIQEQGKINGKDFKCKQCGCTFKHYKEKATCSAECKNKYASSRRKIHNYVCNFCNVAFTRDRKLKEGREFCSVSCSGKHSRRNNKISTAK